MPARIGQYGDWGADLRAVAAPRPLPRLALIAGAFAGGIAVGEQLGEIRVWLWLGMALALSAAVIALRRRDGNIATGLLCAAVFCSGAAWLSVRFYSVAADDLRAWLGGEPVLVRAEGVATGDSRLRRRASGPLAHFDYRPASCAFPMRIDSLLSRDGERIEVRGRVLVRVDEVIAPLRAGDRVRVTGYLVAAGPVSNPGEYDIRRHGRGLGQAGWLSTPGRDLVEVTPAERGFIGRAWLDSRDTVQRRAAAWLLSGLPETHAESRDALLAALLLGQREPELDGVNESFRRVGLAHLLAISGLHLGIVAGLALLVIRGGGRHSRWHGWVLIAVALGYLFLIEVRLPVLRAGIMTIVACAGLCLARTISVGGLVALSGIGLLIWRPDQLFTPGFQLSFGVVLGLIYLSPILRMRFFGLPDALAGSTSAMIGQWMRSAAAVAITAWLVATPIIAYHFGIVSPAGILLSVVGVPVVALLLALGYAKMIVQLLLPSAAVLLGAGLSIVADVMIAIVTAIDTLPGSSLHVPFPSALWALAALGAVFLVIAPQGEALRRGGRIAIAVVALWLFWPLFPGTQPRPPLRVDMIDVGHGSCIVLRSGGETLVYDAGSSSSFAAGRFSIVPALRRLGVRRIDAIAISHPDLDHYSAVLDLAEEFSVDRVYLTQQFIDTAREYPGSAVAYVTDRLAQMMIPMEIVSAGYERPLGAAHLTWLHPSDEDEPYGRDNDHSMVILAEAAGRRALLTGDLEREGMARLMPRQSDLHACIAEMPHHGAHHEMAEAFIGSLEPTVLLQSAPRWRLRDDRWEGRLCGSVTRLVTGRDGLSWAQIGDDGRITAGSFVNGPATLTLRERPR